MVILSLLNSEYDAIIGGISMRQCIILYRDGKTHLINYWQGIAVGNLVNFYEAFHEINCVKVKMNVKINFTSLIFCQNSHI